jgi:GDP-L-fucose synthase
MNEVLGKRVLVTGNTEFLGRHIYRALRKFGPEAVWCLTRGEFDGLSPERLVELFGESRAEIVIHLCDLDLGHDPQRSPAGEAVANDDPGFYDAVRAAGVAKCLVVGSSLAYPPVAAIPWCETEFLNPPPSGSHSPAIQRQREFLLRGLDEAENHELPVVTLLTGELYGPGDELRRQTGSLVDKLLRKTLEARESDRKALALPLSGTQSRDFLFVRDAAEGIALATAKHVRPNPVNIGTGVETALGSLVEMLASGFGYSGHVTWGQKVMGGVSRQCLDCRRAATDIGFSADTRLDAGLRETIAWHERQWSRPPAIAR